MAPQPFCISANPLLFLFSPTQPEPPPEPEPAPTPPQPTLLSGKNPISALMEYAQKSGSVCEFQLLSQEGPPHDPK